MALTKATYSMIQGACANVLDFGAKGDGVTSDTTAIQAAINSGAGAVYFPAGTYVIDDIVYLIANQTLYGDGFASILKQQQDETLYSTAMLWARSTVAGTYLDNVTIHSLQLLGDVVAAGFNQQIHLLATAGVRNFIVFNCLFKGFRGDGIMLSDWVPIPYTPTLPSTDRRHNQDVSITNCIFDGINQNNRQCISVLDCQNIGIANNTFKNSTRADMPGAIDFEPEWSDAFIENVRITNNEFFNIGASSSSGGVISFVTPQATLSQCESFVIEGNTEYACNKPFLQFYLQNPSRSFRIVVANNSSLQSTFINTVGAGYTLWGLNVTGNTCGQINLGQNVAGTVYNKDINIIGNNINAIIDYSILLYNFNGAVIANNVFNQYTAAAIVLAQTVGTGTNITIQNNVFGVSIAGVYTVVASATAPGTLSGNTFVYSNNTSGSGNGNFPAWRTDDCGILVNSNSSVPTFNIQTLPDSFPVGRSMANLSGNTTNYPPVGSVVDYGTLVTYVQSLGIVGGATQSNIWQELHPFCDNGASEGSYWLRQRAPGSNTWGNWYKHTGV